ncbi:914_t:CDS:2, partial [Acaulospora morrowiae]
MSDNDSSSSSSSLFNINSPEIRDPFMDSRQPISSESAQAISDGLSRVERELRSIQFTFSAISAISGGPCRICSRLQDIIGNIRDDIFKVFPNFSRSHSTSRLVRDVLKFTQNLYKEHEVALQRIKELEAAKNERDFFD